MDQFLKEVIEDLSGTPKRLHSKYFYDSNGDRLFQSIMASPEYYLTNCELEIFKEQTRELAVSIRNGFNSFDLVELGAGDATKSSYLLKELMDIKVDFTYMPVDISAAMIEYLELGLPAKIKGLDIVGLNGEYFHMLEKANQLSKKKKAVLMLGANIGNETPANTLLFLRKMRSLLQKGDRVLMGFDLKKNPYTIFAAYNDAGGFTRDFNMNLLHRINRELAGNFDTTQFEHYPTYDPVSGACKSYLISKSKQEVMIAGNRFEFEKNEPIFMEISQKYTIQQIEDMAISADFLPIDHFYDRKQWFVDTIWECI